MRKLVAVLVFPLAACAGKTSGGPDGGGGMPTDSGALSDAIASMDSAGGGDCGQPAQVEYTCPHGFPDGGICARYGGPGDVAPADAGFAVGCEVTLPMCNGFYGVPQTCNCESTPLGDGGPTWLCPQ